jgi:hypothetical protein
MAKNRILTMLRDAVTRLEGSGRDESEDQA